ncbi:tripartite tricarboxylate transporter TctB family protein [Chelativorans sp. J32]|uniref:tripartite tricarboxylate transporter TctB family protein n=1 Tax=Chelativorans sp. J32 TaxID=935840 RepID=UPI000487E528|nr:tripartite tricarboxylate transporter TctB family protein [Chelativorans sp. J32]
MAPEQKERTADLVLMAAVFCVSAVFLVLALQLPPSRFDPLGPGSFPIGICLLLMALSGAGAARLLLGRALGRAETSLIVGIGQEAEYARHPQLAVALFALTVAYALVLQFTPLSFFWTTVLFVALGGILMSRTLAPRIVVTALAVALAAGAVLVFVFTRLLVVALP